MIQKNRTRIISYDSITNINLVIPNQDMPYYIIKLDMGRKNMILPFRVNAASVTLYIRYCSRRLEYMMRQLSKRT